MTPEPDADVAPPAAQPVAPPLAQPASPPASSPAGRAASPSATLFVGRLHREGTGRWTQHAPLVAGSAPRAPPTGIAHAAPPVTAPRPEGSTSRPARTAILLALAHKLRAAIDTGVVASQSDIARHLGVSAARVSQILDLTLLAPRIQEAILEREVHARACEGEGDGEGHRGPDGVADVVTAALRMVAWSEQEAAFGSAGA